MAPVMAWLEATFAAVPLSLLEVWGQFAYLVGLGVAVCAFGGFTFRTTGRFGFGRERQAWDIRAFLCIPLTFIFIVISGYLGSFAVLVPGAQTFESFKDLTVFLTIVLFGFPALVAVPFAYGLSDLLEGVPPEFLLDWLPGYFINPACFWIAYQLIGRDPDFRRAGTWMRYGGFVLIFLAIEPILWGFICSDKFTPEIAYRSITPALFFTTGITWLMAPLAMLIAYPVARRLGLFWAAIGGHVWERPLGSPVWTWKSGPDPTHPGAAPSERGLPIRMYMLAPFVALVLGLVGATAWVTLRSAEAGADKLAGRLHESIAETVAYRLDAYLAGVERSGGSLDAAALHQQMAQLPMAQFGQVAIVNRSGELIGGTAPAGDEVTAGAVSSRAGDNQLYRFAHVTARPLSREVWLARATPYRHARLDLDWIVVTALPEAFFLEGVRTGNSRSALVFAIALLVTLGLAGWLASRVSAPLVQLSSAAGALSAGDLSARVPRTHLRELDALGQSFNGMAARLQEHSDHLNDLVAERTAALSVAVARSESAYEQLRGLETLRDNLVHMIVHDMRSPLMVLAGNLEFIDRAVGSQGSTVSEDLAGAASAVNALTGMANDLLDVSKLEEGRMPLDRTLCDLVGLAGTACRMMAHVDRDRVITLEGTTALVQCDSRLIGRVLENLITNAIKHTPGDGIIRVVVSADASGARVSVADEGPGVPVEARQRIFEKFGTLNSRFDNSYHSAGLGLTFCKLAVEAHGGRIGVDAGSERGSVFWFNLPSD